MNPPQLTYSYLVRISYERLLERCAWCLRSLRSCHDHSNANRMSIARVCILDKWDCEGNRRVVVVCCLMLLDWKPRADAKVPDELAKYVRA